MAPNLFSATLAVRPGPNMASDDEPDLSTDRDRRKPAHKCCGRGSPLVKASLAP